MVQASCAVANFHDLNRSVIPDFKLCNNETECMAKV